MKQETLEETLKNELEFVHNSCRNFDFDLGFKTGGLIGAEWQQEQILDFLYSEITERRDYSASKMCEKVIEFIEQFKNK